MSDPILNKNFSQKSLETWKKLRPFSLDEIKINTDLEIRGENGVSTFYDTVSLEFKQIASDEKFKAGVFLKGSKKLEGVGRRVTRTNYIHEGQFHQDQMHGYSRLIFEDGSYYIGLFRNNKMNGKGLYVSTSG